MMKISKIIMVVCVLLSFTVANTGCYYKELKREEEILQNTRNGANIPLETFKDIKKGMTLDEVLTTVGCEPYQMVYFTGTDSTTEALDSMEWLIDGEMRIYVVEFEKGVVARCGEENYNKIQQEEGQ